MILGQAGGFSISSCEMVGLTLRLAAAAALTGPVPPAVLVLAVAVAALLSLGGLPAT